MNFVVVKEQMGHASIQTTEKHYIRIPDRDLLKGYGAAFGSADRSQSSSADPCRSNRCAIQNLGIELKIRLDTIQQPFYEYGGGLTARSGRDPYFRIEGMWTCCQLCRSH